MPVRSLGIDLMASMTELRQVSTSEALPSLLDITG